MQIVAFISTDSQVALRRVLAIGDSLLVVKSPDALARRVADGDCRLIVVDPTGIRDEEFCLALSAIVASGMTLVIWAPPSRSTSVRVLQASTLVPTIVLLCGVGDDALNLRAIAQLGGVATATSLVLHRLAGRLNALPEDIRNSCTAMFSGVVIPDSVERFATATKWHSRTVQRHFVDVGLANPGVFLRAARIARAWEPLNRATTSLSDTAGACCFESEKAFSAQFSACFGFPPRRAIGRLTRDSFVDRLMDSIVAEAD